MRRTITLAVALLLAPSANAVQMRSMLSAKFPDLPSGASVATVVGNALEEGKRELSRAMYEQNEWCDEPPRNPETGEYEWPQRCDSWEGGLREDLRRGNRDVAGAMQDAGIDFSANVYDPKFITDLIEAEYSDFVTQFNAHRDEIGADLERSFTELEQGAAEVGLAQLSLVNVAQAKAKLGAKGKAKVQGKTLQDVAVVSAVAERGDRGCDDMGRNDDKGKCPPDQTEATMVCPGECCWRGPNSPEEEKSFDDFWRNKRTEERKAREECYLKSSVPAQLNAEMPPAQEMAAMVTQLVTEVVRESQQPQNIEELGQIIGGINQVLLGEAERLGMSEVPAMPDPTDTANKISKFMAWAGAQAASAGGQEEILEGAEDFRFDVLKESYRAERDIKQETGIDVNDPQAAAKALAAEQANLAGGAYDRDAERLARDLGGLGGVTSQAEVLKFASDALGTLAKIAASPDMGREAEAGLREVEHEVEREGAQVIRAVEEQA